MTNTHTLDHSFGGDSPVEVFDCDAEIVGSTAQAIALAFLALVAAALPLRRQDRPPETVRQRRARHSAELFGIWRDRQTPTTTYRRTSWTTTETDSGT